MKVICLVPEQRFTVTGVKIPPHMDFTFANTSDEEEIVRLCKGADYLMANCVSSFLSDATIRKLDTIKYIQVDGAGYEKIDFKTAAKCGLPVANNAGVNAVSVAEAALGMIIALQRRFPMSDIWIKKKKYAELHKILLSEGVGEISDMKIGIIGLGAIGTNLARMLREHEPELVYNDIVWKDKEQEKVLNVSRASFDEIVETCDTVTIHTPLTDLTRNMINEQVLLRMKPNAIFINTSRGPVVDAAAVAKVLEMGRLAGVGIDTMDPEPPGPDHPFVNLSPEAAERVILTPHVAGLTIGAIKRMLQRCLANIDRAEAGIPLHSVVNGVTNARK